MTGPAEAPGELAVSVIVASGRENGCQRLVRAVHQQFEQVGEEAYEIVLVIDGCPRYRWLEAADARVRAIVLPQPVGIARARNAGIEAARGHLLAFLDDDCVPADTWVAALLRMSRDYPKQVAFGGKVIGTDRVNLYAQLRDRVYYYETFGPWYTDAGARTDVLGSPYVNGGNSAYRREALTGAGGFDPLLPAYSDVEVGRRLDLARRAVLSPQMAIHHDHPSRFSSYMLRCWRSGRARGLLWARRGYVQDRPAAVLGAIARNIVWHNAARRRRRITASPLRVVAVLTCQEVVHGLGYGHALIDNLGRRRRAGRRSDGAPGTGVAADLP